MKEPFDPTALRQWLSPRTDEIVGPAQDPFANLLAVWLTSVRGEPCLVWGESYQVGSGPWKRLPEWAAAFVQEIESRAALHGCVAVSGAEALAVLNALASLYPECAGEPECVTLREALQFGSGAVTNDGTSHVRYHEDYHIQMDAPWVYYPNLLVRELWILRDDELVSEVPRSLEQCWLPVSHFVW